MTSSSRSSVLKLLAPLALLAAVAGCEKSDGTDEYLEARAAYEARQFDTAVAALTESLQIAPGNVDALVLLARAQLDLGEIIAAEDAIARAVSLAPDDADAVELAAQIAWHNRAFQKAEDGFRKLTGTDYSPELRSRGWAGLGIVHLQQIGASPVNSAMADKARIEFLQALRLDGNNASAWYHLALLYRDAFHYNEAAADQFEFYLLISAKNEPDDVDRRERVAKKLLPELRELIKRQRLERTGADKRNSSLCAASLKRAEEAYAKRNYRTAKLHYADAYKSDRLCYAAVIGLAKTTALAPDKKETSLDVLKYYRIACELNPSATSTFMTAGALAMRNQRYAQAVEIYSRALAAKPKDAAIVLELVKALVKAGQSSQAQVYRRYGELLKNPAK